MDCLTVDPDCVVDCLSVVPVRIVDMSNMVDCSNVVTGCVVNCRIVDPDSVVDAEKCSVGVICCVVVTSDKQKGDDSGIKSAVVSPEKL